MNVSVVDTERYVMELSNRMPFHFGNVVVTEAPQVVLQLTLDVDGEREIGVASGTSASQWFLKDPGLSLNEIVDKFRAVFATACDGAEGIEAAESPFELWRELYDQVSEWGADTDYPPLLWMYGVSLVEQAVIDAYCRIIDVPFHEAVRNGDLGFDPEAIHDELAGADPADLLPDEPLRKTAIRHTVGLADPLTPADVPEEDRLDDGLPQTLSEYIDQQGVHYFKIKLGADAESDAERLAQIATVVDERDLDEYAFTLDANEGYGTAREFKRQWETIAADPGLQSFLDRLLYVEQPLARNEAFTDDTRETLTDWDERPPVIIDESDAEIESFPTALACGYDGTSHKNCKGVFNGLANACLAEHLRRTEGRECVLSGEDLTTLGPVELQEDLAVNAVIGSTHVERNGHHYFKGLSMLPEDVQTAVLEAHPDLYRRHESGFPTLDIRNGEIELGSVVAAPFGHANDFDPSVFSTLDNWRADE